MNGEERRLDDRRKIAVVERMFTTKTPAGFKVQVKVEGVLNIPGNIRVEGAVYGVEDVWPSNTPVLTQEEIRRMQDDYVAEFRTWLEQSNRFYVYGWTTALPEHGVIAGPAVWDYQLVEERGKRKLVIDLNGVDTKNAANEELRIRPHGCSLFLHIVDSGIWSDELKEENFRMIDARLL